MKQTFKSLLRIDSVTALARRRITVNIIEKVLAKLKKNFKVLDVGSGISNWQNYFNVSNLGEYETLELKEDLPATFHGDFFTLELEKRYSCLIATEFIEHVPDPRAFFRKAHSLLEKDGFLILSFPFLFKIHGDPDDYFRYTKSGIESLVSGLFEINISHAHGGKYQVAWEILIDGKILYPLRIFNRFIASTKSTESAFPLGYVMALRRI